MEIRNTNDVIMFKQLVTSHEFVMFLEKVCRTCDLECEYHFFAVG